MKVWWHLICTRCLPHSKGYIGLGFLTSLYNHVSVCSIIQSITPLCCHQVISPLSTHPQKTFLGKMLCLLTSFTFTIKFEASFSICTQVSVGSSVKRVDFCVFLFSTYARSAASHHQHMSIESPKLLTFVVYSSCIKQVTMFTLFIHGPKLNVVFES